MIAHLAFRASIVVLVTVSLSSCMVNRSVSTIDKGVAYAVSRDQAKRIVDSSLAAFISGDRINTPPADTLTASGYIRAGFDTQTINVTALPASGVNASGVKKDGYGFMMADWGTIGYDETPTKIFDLVQKQAASQGEKLQVAGNKSR